MRHLRPDGRLVASIPSVRNAQVISDLMAGRWRYRPAGILDEGHLRFFTLAEIRELFRSCGLIITGIQRVFEPQHRQWAAAGRPRNLQLGALGYQANSPRDAEELFVEQYLVTARLCAQVPAPGMASIIIPVWNQLEYTKLCLESVRQHTGREHDVIVIDNGSDDGTPAYLASLDWVEVIRNERNEGFVKACNQGIEAAAGDYLVLLNNDTIVTAGWLDGLVTVARQDGNIGMVGPVSNNVSGPQQIPTEYRTVAEMHQWAEAYTRSHGGQTTETERLVGFCLLIKGEVLEYIGLLDERYGLGLFDDDDLCLRARKAGYRLVYTPGVFVRHFGSRTLATLGVDAEAMLHENWRQFRTKWESEPGGAEELSRLYPSIAERVPSLKAVQGQPITADAPEQPGCPTISLCMIARDEEANIANCLRSIKPWVDEMIVVDTGSKDRTPEIARECGARVEHFEWCDDFSAARNESLKYATGDWVFWMDADDRIDEVNGRRLRELVTSAPDDVFGITVRAHCLPRPGEDAGVEMVDHVKLLRNHPDIAFQFHIHEQVLPSIRRLGKRVVYSDVFVIHAGYDTSPEGQRKKRDRDLRLLQLDLESYPEHPFVHFSIGMTAFHMDDLDLAVHHLQKSIDLAGPAESHLRKAYALLAGCYRRRGTWEAARRTCEQGLVVCPNDPELLFNRGMVCHQLSDFPAAEESYRRILDGRTDEPYLRSVDTGITGFKTRHNLAMLYLDAGRPQDAEAQLRQAVTEEPAFVPSWFALADLLRRTSRAGDLEDLTNQVCRT